MHHVQLREKKPRSHRHRWVRVTGDANWDGEECACAATRLVEYEPDRSVTVTTHLVPADALRRSRRDTR